MMRGILSFCALLLPLLVVAQPTFIQHTVATNLPSTLGVVGANLDGTSGLELVAGNYSSGYVYVFSGEADTWTTDQIATGQAGVIDFDIGDFDGDGDEDIAAAMFNGDYIRWWENDNGGWVQHNVAFYDTPRRVEAADLDGDGDLDLVANSSSQGIWWWENDGSGGGWVEHQIFTSGSFWGLAVADMDNDGDIDVASTSQTAGYVRWSENAGGSWTQHIIATPGDGPKDVFPADIDEDGVMDVVVAGNSGSQILWYAGQDADYWASETVATGFGGANDVEAADLDMDGDLDIVGAAYTGNSIAWWENDNGWVYHLVMSNYSGCWNVEVADIDEDGDLDIAGSAYTGSSMYWWEQEGTPGPVQFQLIPQVTTIPPGGGLLLYDASLVSELPNPVTGLSYWSSIELPNGQVFGPLNRINFTLQPFMNIYVTGLSQNVPDLAPPGSYTFTGYIGFYPTAELEDSFGFTKQAAGADNDGSLVFDPADWKAGGDLSAFGGERQNEIAGLKAEALPNAYSLGEAWPNPFNPSTTVAVSLPELAELRLTVHNLAGQQVATLADGLVSAGTHEFAFDGSALAAGVYFVRAQVPGRMDQARKLLLVK